LDLVLLVVDAHGDVGGLFNIQEAYGDCACGCCV
jgi:hypothetical protein